MVNYFKDFSNAAPQSSDLILLATGWTRLIRMDLWLTGAATQIKLSFYEVLYLSWFLLLLCC